MDFVTMFIILEKAMNKFANVCGGKDTSTANLYGTGQVLNYFQKSSCRLKILGAIRVP